MNKFLRFFGWSIEPIKNGSTKHEKAVAKTSVSKGELSEAALDAALADITSVTATEVMIDERVLRAGDEIRRMQMLERDRRILEEHANAIHRQQQMDYYWNSLQSRDSQNAVQSVEQRPAPAGSSGPSSSVGAYISAAEWNEGPASTTMPNDAIWRSEYKVSLRDMKWNEPEEYKEGFGSAEDGEAVFLEKQLSRKERKFFSSTAECPECENAFIFGDRDSEVVCPVCKHEFIPYQKEVDADISKEYISGNVSYDSTGHVAPSIDTVGGGYPLSVGYMSGISGRGTGYTEYTGAYIGSGVQNATTSTAQWHAVGQSVASSDPSMPKASTAQLAPRQMASSTPPSIGKVHVANPPTAWIPWQGRNKSQT